MAKMSGFIYQDRYWEQLKELSDQELGRLVRALNYYHMSGETQELKGRESMAYTFIKYEIDEAEKSYQSKCETNRSNRLKNKESSTTVNERQQPLTNDNDRQQPSTSVVNRIEHNRKECIYEEEEEKRAREETPTYGSGLGSMLTDEDLQKGMEEQQAVDRIRATWEECGCRFSDRDEKTMHELLEKHTEEQIIKAVESAHDHNARGNWGYIKAVLEGGNKGGRTGGTAQSRGCAPRYTNGTGELPDWYPERI